MPPSRNMKNITREQIIELYEVRRLSMKRTAYELGVYVDTLKARMADFGIKSRSKCHRHPNTVEYNRHVQKCASARGRDILRMIDKGMTIPEIAKLEGVSRNRIYQIIRRYRPSNQPAKQTEELCPA